MKDQLQIAFYEEGFTIDVPKKWTSLFSKTKTRAVAFKPPFAYIWGKILKASQKASFSDLEIEDFEHLSKKQLWDAARIVGLSASRYGTFSLLFAAYFYTHLDAKKLGKLAYMVIMLNRTEHFSYIFSNINAFIWANTSEQEKAALSGRWMYK